MRVHSYLVKLPVALGLILATLFVSPAVSHAGPLDWLRTLFLGNQSTSHSVRLPVKVSTTTTILADLARNVGGNRVNVTSVVPLGGDPHTYDPTPNEARAVATADVLFMNGQGLELWADKLIRNTGRRDLKVVVVSAELTPLPGPTFTAHTHSDGDPHFWLDVTYAIQYVRVIKKELSQLDPAGASVHESNARRYIEELEELDHWFRQQVDQIPENRRKLVTYHDAFGYMAKAYDLELVGFLVRNPDREPSARDMAAIAQRMRTLAVPAIFAEPQINPKFAEALAREAGVKVHYLYSDALTSAVPTYIDMMRYNARSLVEGLR